MGIQKLWISVLLIGVSLYSFPSHTHKNKKFPFIHIGKEKIIFKNNKATLLVEKHPWKVKLVDQNGEIHYSDSQEPHFFVGSNWITPEGKVVIKNISENSALINVTTSDGNTISFSVEKAGDTGFKVKYTLVGAKVAKIKGIIKLNPVEEIYGFGEDWNGNLAQRGQLIDIWDENGTPDECAWMPYYVSTKNYAFFLDYGGRVRFDIGQHNSNELSYEMPTDELKYTVLLGQNIASTVQNFVALNGMPAKPPRWTFEPWFWLIGDPDIPGADVSTLRGHHFIEMVDKLKELNIPVGVTWFEPPWQEARTTFVPNKDFSPDLKKLIYSLKEKGVKTLAWTVPYTTPGTTNWDEAVKNGYLIKKPQGETEDGNVKIGRSGEVEGDFYNYIDFYNPDAFKWWQAQINKAIDLGLKGFKLDAGQQINSDGILYGGRIGKDVHNSYALEYNKIFYETLEKKLGDDFLMIPRAAWIGSSSYTNFKWPGDLSGSFANNGLSASIYSSLSLGLSGIPFVSTDIGGFADRPPQEETWLRWAQFGAMLPGMETLHMPWWYSQQAIEHYRYLAWLHTDLIPYWETLANVAHEKGTPICRPLIWDYQDDMNTWRIKDEFIVGKYLLVAPFINSERAREVYLPKGNWIDFWDENEVLAGQKNVRWFKGWNESLYKFPLYIKEGAVIPMEVSNDITGFGSKYSETFITLAVWPKINVENEFILHDREGPVPITTDWKNSKKLIFKWEGSSKDYIFRISLQKNIDPAQIFSNNNSLQQYNSLDLFQKTNQDGWYYDKDDQKLWIKKLNDENSGVLSIILK